MSAQPPYQEEPIYVEYLQRGAHHHYDDANDTAAEQRPIDGSLCWIDWAAIPAAPPAPAPWPGGPAVGGVRGVLGVPLGPVPGDPFRFAYQFSAGAVPPFDRFALMVPGDFSGGAYAPTLRDSAGAVVPYEPPVWVADGLLMVVEFKYRTPAQLGYAPPFTIDYWRYVGPTAGVSLTIANEGAGTGRVYDTTVAGVAQLRTLLADAADAGSGLAVADAGPEILFSNTLTGANPGASGPGTAQVFAGPKTAGVLNFRSLVSGMGVTVTQAGDDITFSSGGGGLSGLANEGPGVGVYDGTILATAVLRSLVADAAAGTEGIALAVAGTSLVDQRIVVSNTLTGGNLGGGAAVFATKTAGAVLNFRSLVAGAGSGLTVTQNANDVTFAAAAGSVVGIANEGGGAGVFDAVVANTANLRTLLGTPGNGLTVTQNATTITIDNTLSGQNVGTGTGVLFSGKVGAVLQFHSLVGTLNGLTVSAPVGETITIDNTLTGQNVGTGTGVIFSGKVGAVLQFHSLVGTLNGLTVSAPVGETITIDNTLTGANLGGVGSVNVFSAKVGAILNFRSLIAAASSGLTFTQNVNDITVSATAGSVVGIANEGGGAGVFDAVVANTANLRSLLGTPGNGLTVTQNATTITIDNTLTGQNIGTGTGVIFSGKVGAVLQFHSLVGTLNGLTVSAPVGETITIDNTLSGQNVGTGTGILFSAKSGALLQFHSLVGTLNGLTVSAPVGETITIDNTLTGQNIGTGTGVIFSAKSGALLQFHSLVGTLNGLTVSAPVGETITIDNTLSGQNVGSGAGVLFSAKSGALLQFHSLTGTLNGLTVSAPVGETITIDNTLTGANLPGGAFVFSAKVGASLNFRSLVAAASSGLTFTQNANDITASATTGTVITALTNEGPGTGVFDAISGNTAFLRSLIASTAVGTEGIALALAGTTLVDQRIVISNTVTGGNIGGGTGTLFAAKTAGAVLQFNSLAGTASGLTVSAPAAGTITIDNTLTGANVGTLGAGTGQVFSAKVGAALNFRSLVAGSNVTVTQAGNNITIAATAAAANLNIWRVTDTKLNGTNGGNANAGTVQTRTLNTLVSAGPTPANVTLAANVLTIQPGRYYICGSAPAYDVSGHNAYLATSPGGAVVLRGQSSYNNSNTTGTVSAFAGFVEPIVATNYRVDHYTTGTQAGTGLGRPTGQGVGFNEVYTELTILQIA